MEHSLKYIDTLNEIGIALSAEKDHARLLEKIVEGAVQLTNADGATLYIKDEQQLAFAVFINRSLKLEFSQPTEKNRPGALFKPIHLCDKNGQPNLNNIVSSCVIQNQTINIANAYHATNMDFSGTHAMDKKLNYRSISFLAIPLRNYENKILGALQLINAIDEKTGEIIPFSEEKARLAESLASQAAITLTQQELIAAQKNLFEAFIQLIARAIDEKSVYTSNHCARVPTLTMMIAEALQKSKKAPFKDFSLTSDQLEELRIAAWLHDCGKIVTPEHVMDKRTKLETISDRVEVIKLRLEILKRDLKIAALEKQMKAQADLNLAGDNDYQNAVKALDEAREFIERVNQGGEVLHPEDKARIVKLATLYHYLTSDGSRMPLLEEKDIMNLCISRGTLNDEERKVIQNHANVTLKMLGSLPYPDYLKNVPVIAGSHHERLDGGGYPLGIKSDQILIQARILAIADIFEALTAADRPYKSPKKLSETLAIMADMKRSGHIDPNLFDFFIQEKIYLTYAEKFLPAGQIDAIDEAAILH